jgi:hypothetical protein
VNSTALEVLKHFDILLCILLVTGILHQGKIIGKLVECIALFLGDYKKKGKQIEKALRDFKD